jgi:hypothetical protein
MIRVELSGCSNAMREETSRLSPPAVVTACSHSPSRTEEGTGAYR